MLVSDLLSVKDVRPVIQLEERGHWDEVAGSFVWTGDIRPCLLGFAEALASGQGGGIFVKGHYGSGKSHLLSFLAMQAGNWAHLSREFSIDGLPSLAAIPVSLTKWPASRALESIVLESVVVECPGLGLAGNREEQWTRIVASLKARGRSGFVLLLDEVSEFLKCKSSPAGQAEDLRFLQFLAEFCSLRSSWVIAAIQEEIEGMGASSRETALKLKDRFPARWTLGRMHLGEMISLRLLERKPGAEAALGRYCEELRSGWPSMRIEAGAFLRDYPLHPVTASLLSGLGRLFSEHRGALVFVRQVLLGGVEGGTGPFLEREFRSLVTPDILYDFFRQRIREIAQLRQYDAEVLAHLEQRITEILPAEDVELAKKALKTLLLCAMDPARAGADPLLLAWASGERILPDEAKSAEFMEKRIVGPLLGRANYLAFSDGRFVIDLGRQGHELLSAALAEKTAGVNLGGPGAWARLMPLMDRRPLELAQLWRDPLSLGAITWLNSARAVSCAWGAKGGPVQGGVEADLRILRPLEECGERADQVLYWIPRKPDKKESRSLTEAVALKALIEEPADTALDARVRDEAAKKMELESKECRRIMEALYREGEWFVGEARIGLPPDWHRKDTLEGCLEDAVYELLLRRHPLFPSVAPRSPYFGESALAGAVDFFVRRGEVTEAELSASGCREAVSGLLRPWGLVQKSGARLRFAWDPAASLLASELERLRAESGGGLALVRKGLEKGRFGLPPALSSFLVWCAVSGGAYRALRRGEVVPEAKLSFQNLGGLEAIEPEKGVGDAELALLLGHPFFRMAERSSRGLALERSLWAFFLDRTRPAAAWLEEWRLLRPERALRFAAPALGRFRSVIGFFLSSPPRDPQAFRAGLSLLAADPARLEELDHGLVWGAAFSRFLDRSGVSFAKAWAYVLDEFLDGLPSGRPWDDLGRRREELLSEYEGWSADGPFPDAQEWCVSAERWIRDWRAAYREVHEQARPRPAPGREEQDFRLAFACFADISELWRRLEESGCGRDLEPELEDRPFCRCGLRPRVQEPAAAPADDAPGEDPYRPLFALLGANGFVREDTEALRSLVVSGRFGEALALWGEMRKKKSQAPARRLSISSLRGRWAGRSWTRKQLLRDFEEFLGGDETNQYDIGD